MCSKSLEKGHGASSWPILPSEVWLVLFKALVQNGGTLGSLAAVSRSWQTEVEPYNFALIKLTPSRLIDFDSMTRRCRALVGRIWFCLELDDCDCRTCEREIPLNKQVLASLDISNADNRPITEAFQDLFMVLSTWKGNGNLELDISIDSTCDSGAGSEYLHFMHRFPSNTQGSGSVEPTAGCQYSTRPRNLLVEMIHSFMGGPCDNAQLENDWWDQLPSVQAVTSVLLRQKNGRRWKPNSLARMLARFPRLQEIHYEPCRERHPMQEPTDEDSLGLLESIQGLDKTLKKVVMFERFNPQDPATLDYFLNGFRVTKINPAPLAAVGRMVARASLRLEHIAASFIADASHFFQVEAAWRWPNLSSLVLTSKRLTPEQNPAKIGTMLQAAAAAAMKMPQLETMEIWNGRKGFAALFRYQTSRQYRQATITWRATWNLTMEQPVIPAWEAVLHQWGGWKLHLVQETLDGSVIKSHADAIHYLMLSSEAIRPTTLQQIRFEENAMKVEDDVQQA